MAPEPDYGRGGDAIKTALTRFQAARYPRRGRKEMNLMTVLRTIAAALALCLAAGAARAADYAPLDCARARAPADRTVCRNYDLGQREARMATLFEWTMSLTAMGQRGDIGDAQRAFIRTRAACGDRIACIRAAYDARIADLEKVMKGIAVRGPF